MANLTEVQLPNGTTYNLVDDESGYVTEAEVEGMIGDKADKTLVSYCSCSTAAATAQKEVVAPEGWELESGRIIAVKFVNTNTAQNPTLKVGTADAKGIYYNNAVVTTGSLFAGGEADKVTLYIYDGTRFVWLGHSIDNNTTYTAMSVSELTTGTATTSRTVRADYLKNGINQLIQTKAKADLTPISATGTTNNSGSVIPSGYFFYLNGTLCKALQDIAVNATFSLNTNYRVESQGAINDILRLVNIDNLAMQYAGENWEIGNFWTDINGNRIRLDTNIRKIKYSVSTNGGSTYTPLWELKPIQLYTTPSAYTGSIDANGRYNISNIDLAYDSIEILSIYVNYMTYGQVYGVMPTRVNANTTGCVLFGAPNSAFGDLTVAIAYRYK